MQKYNLTAIFPGLNVETTIVDTLKSFLSIDFSRIEKLEIIMINDGSKDNTSKVAREFLSTVPNLDYTVIDHDKNLNIPTSYNEGINLAKHDLVALIQADIEFPDADLLSKMIVNLEEKNLLATYPYVLHPKEIWDGYNLWQKAMFDRLVGKRSPGNFTKCVVGYKKSFIEAGLYDTTINSGEDREMFERIIKLGKSEITDVDIIHIHSKDPNFEIRNLFRKEAQEAEGAGVMLKRYGLTDDMETTFFILLRPIILCTLFIPILWPITILFVYFYTKNIYKFERKHKDIWKMPFVTIARLGIYSYFLLRGFIKGYTATEYFKK